MEHAARCPARQEYCYRNLDRHDWLPESHIKSGRVLAGHGWAKVLRGAEECVEANPPE